MEMWQVLKCIKGSIGLHGMPIPKKTVAPSENSPSALDQKSPSEADCASRYAINIFSSTQPRGRDGYTRWAIVQSADNHFLCHLVTGQVEVIDGSHADAQEAMFSLWGIDDIPTLDYIPTMGNLRHQRYYPARCARLGRGQI